MRCIESLEPRKLFSGTVEVIDRVLTITGTDDADTLTIMNGFQSVDRAFLPNGAYLNITLNGVTTTHLYNTAVKVDLRGGDDRADVSLSGYPPGISVIAIFPPPNFVLINAGDGNDVVHSKNGVPTRIIGGAGNDDLSGNARAVTAERVPYSHDRLSRGYTQIDGGEGNDVVTGGDVLRGGKGDDSITGGTSYLIARFWDENRVIDGFRRPSEVVHSDTFSSTERATSVFGGAGNDTIVTEFGSDWIEGGTGDDSITAGYGDDTVSGDDGDDYLNGNEGNDFLDGGAGNDTLVGSLPGQTSPRFAVYVVEGTDITNLRVTSESNTLLGGDGNDLLIGGDGQDLLRGQIGNDTLEGQVGDDTLSGGRGDDQLFGGRGYDLLTGGRGADLLVGGLGDDTLNARDRLWTDTLDGRVGSDVAMIDLVGRLRDSYRNVTLV